MSDQPHEPIGLTRRQTLGVLAAGGAAIALPRLMMPGAALAAGAAENEETLKLFLGRETMPIAPESAKRFTSACQYCNVGCGYVISTWPVDETPDVAPSDQPATALGDWVSPSFVTRREIDGVDSFISVVPDKDCVVNRGDHSPRGGTNALTVYTEYEHPLRNPQASTAEERHLYPMMRDAKGGELRQVTWDEALDRVADELKKALDEGGPSSIGVWAADHLSPEMNYTSTRMFFAPAPVGLYDDKLGPDEGVAVRAIHNRAKWNSEHPHLGDNFGSANTLLYSYSDYENADTVLVSGANSYETGTVLWNRIAAKGNKKIVIDPRRTVPAANAKDTGGLHLQLVPNTDVVLLNSIMNVILEENLQDQEFIDSRVEPDTFEALRTLVSQEKYTPENTEAVTGVPAADVRAAAALLGAPNKSSILFEKGIIWSGTQNKQVMSTYANLALLIGAIGRPGQVFGRQGGHQSAYMYDFDWPHPQGGDDRRNLWQELEKGSIKALVVSICNPIRMQQQSTQLRQFMEQVPFVVDMNVRPSDITQVADVVLPAATWGEYTYTRENLERRLRVNQGFVPPAGESKAEYLIFNDMARRFGEKHGVIDPDEWQYADWESVYDAMRETGEGKALGLNLLSSQALVELGNNGIQMPCTEQDGELVGLKRYYEDDFPTDSGKASFTPYDQEWTDAEPLAFLPEEIRPNDEYPYFLTTVRYQAVWQSGYSYRWTTELAKQVRYNEITVNPQDATTIGVADGDWLEITNQYSRCEGVTNVSDMVPKGVMSVIFGWQGPTDADGYGNPAYYGNALIGGGKLQQKSNAAFFKNNRCAAAKLDRPPVTAESDPAMSFGDRTSDGFAQQGAAGNPASQATDPLEGA